jgi:hypothetical protein
LLDTPAATAMLHGRRSLRNKMRGIPEELPQNSALILAACVRPSTAFDRAESQRSPPLRYSLHFTKDAH